VSLQVEEAGEWRKLHYAEFGSLYSTSNVVRAIKSKWTGLFIYLFVMYLTTLILVEMCRMSWKTRNKNTILVG
jgi:hypothetical protein